MKREIKYMLMLAGAVCLASCSLDEYNPAGATEEAVFTTPEGIETGINGCYTYTRTVWGKEEGHYLLEAGTDLWTGASDNNKPNLTDYSNLSATEPYINDRLWKNSYTAINLCNTMLTYFDQALGQSDYRNQREAEVRFLRAFHWWLLTESFGDIHFSTKPSRGIITTANKTAPTVVYTQIFEDLKFAITHLKATNTDYGRVTKAAAEAFMARVSLTRGNWADAITYAKNVINNYGFQLVDDYAKLWGAANEKNSEVIWAIPQHTTENLNGSGTFLLKTYLSRYQNFPGLVTEIQYGDPASRLMPTYHLLSLFDRTNDARWAASFQSEWYGNTTPPEWTEKDKETNPAVTVGQPRFATGDLALKVTFDVLSDEEKFPFVPYTTFDVNDMYDSQTRKPMARTAFFALKKHMDETISAVNQTNIRKDVFVIRLAEMFLIVAEADMQLNGPTGTDAVGYFNRLREKRVAAGGNVAAMCVSSVPNIDFILDERARELAGEQLRWLDLKRTGKLVERVKAYNPDAAAYIKDFHTVRPIPQSQIDLVTNKDEFKQNTGY
jgi:hypothetical protein